jgi:hypothetical protein
VVAAGLATDAVETAKIKDANVTADKLSTGAVTAGKIADGGVDTAERLASDVVTTVKILNANVTTAKIADANVTLAKLANIGTDKLIGRDTTGSGVPEEIGVGGGLQFSGAQTIRIADGGVSVTKIADGSVTASKLNADSVTTVKILDANVTTAKILDANVTTAKILNENVTTAKIAQGAITNTCLADNAVNTQKLNNDAVTTAKIANGNVTTAKLEYKEYVAIVSQTGTSAPTASVIANTIGTVVWTYTSTGFYAADTSSLFTSGKTVIFIDNLASGASAITQAGWEDVGSCTVSTRTDAGALTNGILANASVMIRVYP